MSSKPGKASELLAGLPAVYQILEHPRIATLCTRVQRELVVAEIQNCLERHRKAQRERNMRPPSVEEVAAEVAATVESWFVPSLKPVLNLTGTLLHTNLGRAPLSVEAVSAMAKASAAVNLEYDLAAGKRGDRDTLIENLLCRLSAAEAATVVNNNAAAVYLALNTLANRKRVVVSRGELVEIGDSFRMPDIIRASGCRLMEVGTTNRTHLSDYERALDEGGALLLKVHPSNYRVTGFTEETSLAQLVELGRKREVPVVVDLGSGALVDTTRFGLPTEPTVQETVHAGADLVTFSGDKLLGGPQAGLVVGRREYLQRLKRSPMKRALRVNKITLAALEATLRAYLSPESIDKTLPTYRMMARDVSEIERLAAEILPYVERWAQGRARAEIIAGESQVGSGSLPDATLPTWLIALAPLKGAPETLARVLRGLNPPVIGRVHGGKVLLDLRGLLEAQPLVEALTVAARS
ncbi:MAG: L-seryl-tRNA(Sec) selenium transferase [Pseudomonadota bacterium]